MQTADRICNFNRHYAEFAGYWEQTSFLKEESEASGEISFYDSNTGNERFFEKRSNVHDIRHSEGVDQVSHAPSGVDDPLGTRGISAHRAHTPPIHNNVREHAPTRFAAVVFWELG